jgi:hypothetical protein
MRTTHGTTGPSNGAPTPTNQGPEALRTSVRDALAREQRVEAPSASGRRAPRTGAASLSAASLSAASLSAASLSAASLSAASLSAASLSHRQGRGSGRGRSGAPRGQQPNRCQALRRRGG